MPGVRAGEGLIRVGGHAGWLTAAGAGPPVVLLASTLVLARSYQPVAEKLRRSFRVHTVEMPGSGRGSRLAAPWDVEAYAGWVAGLFDALGLERATVIGHSNSGGVALALAALHPGRVGRLVLADTVGADLAHSLPRVVLSRVLDGVLELWLTVGAWHHVAYNVVAHTGNFL